MIDFQRTKENMKIINCAELARRAGCSPPLLTMIVAGKYRHMEGQKAQAVLSELRRLNLLVETEASEA